MEQVKGSEGWVTVPGRSKQRMLYFLSYLKTLNPNYSQMQWKAFTVLKTDKTGIKGYKWHR